MRQPRQSCGYYNSWCLALLILLPGITQSQEQWSSQAYGYAATQQLQQQQQQQQQQQRYNARPTQSYETPGTAHAYSIWSGAPIVVANDLESERSYNNAGGHVYYNPYDYDAVQQRQTPTRATNHNYNNVPGTHYYSQTEQQQQAQHQPGLDAELERREMLAAAEARREESSTVVHIGGQNGANYYQAPQALRRDFAAKYAKHYANYLRNNPQRLQPLYNTGAQFNDK